MTANGTSSRLPVRLLALLAVACLVVAGAPTAASAQEDLEGSGSASDPYVITDAEGLQAMQQDLGAHYVLGEDVDATATAEWNDGQGFEPIGSYENPFAGTFDGQGNEIEGLSIQRPSGNRVGLFGATDSGAAVTNVSLSEVDVLGDLRVGTLIGFDDGGEVRGVTVTGEVHARRGRAAGVVAQLSGDATNVAVDASVSSDGEAAGGVAGSLNPDGSISNAAVSGEITAESGRAGGIAATSTSVISDSVVTGSVSGDTDVGGIIGGSSASIKSPTIERTLAAASVEGSDNVGGVAGDSGGLQVRDVYWQPSSFAEQAAGGGSISVTEVDQSAATGADAPEALEWLDFSGTFLATDEYPVHQWRVEGISLELGQEAIGEGETTPATVALDLAGGGTVDATSAATFDSETAVAEVEDGTLEARSQGVTEIEASVLEYADAVEVEVLEPPAIELQNASLLAPAVEAGATTTVTATYENTGGPGSRDVAVAVDGETVAEETVAVEADESRTVELSLSPNGGGPVAVDGESVGTLEIVEPGTVSLEDVSVPEAVGAGGSYEVTAELANDADVAVARSVAFRVRGERFAEPAVATAPDGSTATVEHALTEQGPATHVASVGEAELTATLDVVEPFDVAVESVDVPSSATVDAPVEATATVTNEGGPGATTVTFSADDEPVHEETVDLARGASTTVTANVTPSAAGELTLAVAASNASQSTTVDVAAADDGGSGGLPGGLLAGAAAVLVAAIAGVAWGRR